MSSSRMPVLAAVTARSLALMELLERVADPRDPRGVRHPLAAVLSLGVAAVLSGARSFTGTPLGALLQALAREAAEFSWVSFQGPLVLLGSFDGQWRSPPKS